MKKFEDPFAPTPEGFHLRVEQTLNGLEEREMTRRKFSAGMAIALVMVMLLAAAVGTAAVTGGYVGWDGIFHAYEENPQVEVPEASAYEKPYDDLLSAVPRGEYWTVTKDGTEVNGVLSGFFAYDEAEFLSMIEGTDLPVPSLPEGYRFFSASFLTEPEDEPYVEILLEDGAVVSKYELKEPIAGEIDNYDYQFCKNYGNAHAIYAQIVPASEHLLDDCVMHVNENQTAEAVEIEGFEYGLYVYDSEFGLASCLLMKDIGDKMLRVDITAFEDLPKEAVLNLFNPDGNIDLSDAEVETSDYAQIMREVPEGEYWELHGAKIEGHIVSRSNDPAVADFDALAKLTNLPLPTLPEDCKVTSIYAMPAIETDFYEEIVMENGDTLRKYKLAELVEGDLEYYRFIFEDAYGFSTTCEVFTETAAQTRGGDPDTLENEFRDAMERSVPGFDSVLQKGMEFENDPSKLLMTDGEVSILFTFFHYYPDPHDLIAMFAAE